MFIIATQQMTDFPEWLPPLIVYPILILIILKIRKSSRKKKQLKKDFPNDVRSIYAAFHHVNGLPFAENLFCEIFSYPDRIVFKSGTTEVKLLRNKITDMCIKTDTEFQKQAVSSVGGAIAGGMMFGPLGAIIGGRAKDKKVKTVTQYLIITYTGEQGELKYIGFDVKNNPLPASKLVKEFRKLNTNSGVQIEL